MNVDAEAPSLADVRKCLKEADSWDPALSEKEMLDLYWALQNSHNTANEEDEQRRIFEQTEANCSMIEELRRKSVPVHSDQESFEIADSDVIENDDAVSNGSEDDLKMKAKEKPFAPRTWSHQKKRAKPLSDNENEIPTMSTPAKPIQRQKQHETENIVDVDVFNSIPTTHKPLKRISVSPKYDPPVYCNPKFMNVEYNHRARIIFNYHRDLLQKYNNYQRQSIFQAPWGEPIQTNSRFNGYLERKIEKVEDVESLQENLEVDAFVVTSKEDKNSDDDFETYVSKSGRQTKRKLYTETTDDNESEWKKRSKTNLTESETKKIPPKKRRGLCSLSNEDIMKRSKIFADNNNTNSTRTEKMFDQLVEDGRKKKEAEGEMEKFTQTLEQISGEEDVGEQDVAELVHIEEPFIRRRVVPPSYAKKPAGVGKNKSGGRGKNKKNGGTKKSAQVGSSQEAGSQKYDSLEFSKFTPKSGSKQKGSCPVCNEEFFLSELVEHTPFCLDTYNQNGVPAKRESGFCQERITCENCDQVLPLDMDYAVHVKDCLQQKNKKW